MAALSPTLLSDKNERTRTYELKLGRDRILALLTETMEHPPPSAARMTITVPSGGDYSGEVLEVGEDGDIEIRWEEVEESES